MNDQQLLEKYQAMAAAARAYRPSEGGQISYRENQAILALAEGHVRQLEEKIRADAQAAGLL